MGIFHEAQCGLQSFLLRYGITVHDKLLDQSQVLGELGMLLVSQSWKEFDDFLVARLTRLPCLEHRIKQQDDTEVTEH